MISGWYPERDYFALIDALVRTFDPKVDPWRVFAKYSAKVDIGGGGPEAASGGARGVYRTYASGTASEPVLFFRRALKLWSQYHDTGTMELRGGRESTNSVFLRLAGFNIPLEGFVRLQGYYLEEYGRLIGLPLQASVVRSTASGDPFCEWELGLEPTDVTRAYVASLPQV